LTETACQVYPHVESYPMEVKGDGRWILPVLQSSRTAHLFFNRKATLEKGALYSNCRSGFGEIPRSKYDFDVVGHYFRPDIFRLSVNTHPTRPVVVSSRDEGGHPGEAFGKHDF
jgi:hypothetical protein